METDTSAQEARNGKDIQGIQWEGFKYTRDEFRETRLKQYENFVNILTPRSLEQLHKVSIAHRTDYILHDVISSLKNRYMKFFCHNR